MFTRSAWKKVIRTKRLKLRYASSHSVSDRQELVPGFSQTKLEESTCLLIGAGGINSEVSEGLARKGMGCMKILDGDTVELTNLNRQLFFAKDIAKPKGIRLAVNLAKHATCGTTFYGYDLDFQDALSVGIDLSCDLGVCGVDNNPTRTAVARHFLTVGKPVVFIAVDLKAEQGYVFIQKPGEACFGCLFPNSLDGHKMPCRTPAVKDVLKVVAGLALYAIDSLLMDRPIGWNYRNVHLAGFAPSNELTIERKPDCPLCGKGGV